MPIPLGAVLLVAIARPAAQRLLFRVAQSGQPSAVALTGFAVRQLWTSDDSDSSLSTALSEHLGTVVHVETVEGTFELRKAQIRWGRDGGAAGGSDDAVTTHHFLKAPGGTPSATWVAADFIAAEAAMIAFWDAIKNQYTARTSLKQIRWYRTGPSIPLSGAPVRIADPASPGTVANTNGASPPQVAISVTEKTSSAPNWGRFYLPAPIDTHATMFGRIGGTFQLAISDAAGAMYEAFIAAGLFGVVYSSAKPARETKGGTELPAVPARAFPVKETQVDDLYDVIRSRRWNEPLLRIQNAVAGS